LRGTAAHRDRACLTRHVVLLFGQSAQKRLMESNVLLVGLTGLGVEIGTFSVLKVPQKCCVLTERWWWSVLQ
jgi:hypothetical protein